MTDAEKIALYEDMLGITENNDRYTKLRDAFEMSPGATWLLSRLTAAKGRWIPKGVLLDAIPGVDAADDRQAQNVKVRIAEIRKRLGKSVIDWDRELGYRLSKSGIEAVERVLLVHRVTWYPGPPVAMPRPPRPTPIIPPAPVIVVHPQRQREPSTLDRIIEHGARCAAGLGPGSRS